MNIVETIAKIKNKGQNKKATNVENNQVIIIKIKISINASKDKMVSKNATNRLIIPQNKNIGTINKKNNSPVKLVFSTHINLVK